MAPRSSRDSSQRRGERRRTHRYTGSNSELLSPSRLPYPDSNSPSPSPTKSRPKRTRRRPQQPAESDTSKSTSNALSAGSLAQLDSANHNLGWSDYDGIRPRDREHVLVDSEEELLRRQERRVKRERRRQQRQEGLGRNEEHRERRGRGGGEPSATLDVSERHAGRDRRRKERQEDLEDRREQPRKRRIVSGTHLEQGTLQYPEKEAYRNEQYLRGGTASEASEEEYELRRKRRKRWISKSLYS